MKVTTRRVVLSAGLIALAITPVVLYRASLTDVPAPEQRRARLIERGIPATGYSDHQIERTLAYIDEGLEPDVASLRAELEALDAPESSACALARESNRADTDPQFARDVEKICVAWRKLMWDYAVAHAAEVETGDPVAVERTKNAFAMMDMALMRELMRAGGGEPEAPPTAAGSSAIETFEPTLGPETQEEP